MSKAAQNGAVASQSSLELLEKMIGEALVQTGKALRVQSKTGEVADMVRQDARKRIETATVRFNGALDELEDEIMMAKSMLNQQLQDLRVKRQVQDEMSIEATASSTQEPSMMTDRAPKPSPVPEAPMMAGIDPISQYAAAIPKSATGVKGNVRPIPLPRPSTDKVKAVSTPPQSSPRLAQGAAQPQQQIKVSSQNDGKSKPKSIPETVDPTIADNPLSSTDPGASMLDIDSLDTSIDNFLDLTGDDSTNSDTAAGNAAFTDMMFTVDPTDSNQATLQIMPDMANFEDLPEATGTADDMDDIFGDFETTDGNDFSNQNLDDLLAGFGDTAGGQLDDSFMSDLGA